MFTLAFISASGGAGKTTLAINTAASLAIDGKRVLFVDLDPSATATRVLLGDTFNMCNLKTLMHELVRYHEGYSRSPPVVKDCLHIHKITNNNAAFYVLPGGNLDEISSEIKNVSTWGRLLKELIDIAMQDTKYTFDVIVVDSPNWVYQFFNMTFALAPLYVAVTRPGAQEIKKFVDFLSIVINRLRSSTQSRDIFIPQGRDYESLVSYVVNQYRSSLSAQNVVELWNEVNRRVREEFPNVYPLTNDEPDQYYGDKETPFVGFKYLDDISLDSYVEKGPLYARIGSKGRSKDAARPVKQFHAYYESLKQFISYMALVDVSHSGDDLW